VVEHAPVVAVAEDQPGGHPEKVAALAARTMIGRNGLAEDFAGAAVFLASPASSYITGQSVFVDGGLSVH
ncbi:SDR family oxidoreductase, partial [Streptomyces sp. NPDC006386]|uniref:SDR family oxidoreductase n=1 Tax=Streptomyces sp. NPDC006386 TaxID=3156762 RepID=UPI0033A15162